ncbi:MAG: 4-oxalocrotonate tautomerase DmpI [Synergistaceae bacterium]|jgi:4-oxalocrotonate tautomerase|nr:tautomerase family protein [Synergistaceae bacterium]
MPVIKVECAAMNVETKEKLIKSLTQTASSIMGIPEAACIVLLNERSKDNIGVGGEMLSKKQR